MRGSGRIGVAVLAVLAIGGCGGDGDEEAAPESQGASSGAPPPNVVVIMTDDQTVAQMQGLPQTRRLIGGAGVTFDDFYVTDPLCCPSRTTFLTGQYAHNHGVISNLGDNSYPALRQRHTLGVWLQGAGYRTIHIGKFLNSYGLERPRHVPPGWSDWHAMLEPTAQSYYDYTLNENGELRDYGNADSDYKTDVIGRKSVEAIDRAKEAGKPFFMFVGFNAPHAPSTPSRQDEGTLGTPPPPDSPAFDEADLSDKPGYLRDRPPLGAGAMAQIASRGERTLESLLAVDRQVARIVGELRHEGELEDTYVFFTSDNGYLDGEHRLEFGKLVPYEESARVPLLVRGPGIPAGSTSKALVGNIDLAPTITGLAGAEPTVPADGRSLLPFALHPSREEERPLLIESLVRDPSTYYGYPYEAIHTPRYLYAEYDTGDRELYDLARDPYELESRHDDPGYAATREALAAALDRLRDCAGAACRLPPVDVPDPETSQP